MEYVTQPYGVYIKTDAESRITVINSSAFLPDIDGWVKIDEGYGDRYHHAQGNYLPGPLMDARGVYRYAVVPLEATDAEPLTVFYKDDAPWAVVERTAEEMDADYTLPEDNPGTGDGDLAKQVAALQQRVAAQTAQLAAYEAAYTEGVQNA